MKPLKKTSAQKKLAKLVLEKKLSKRSIIYSWVNELIAGSKEFRPVFTRGSSWKYSTLFDKRDEFTNVLYLMKIEYTSGNDAPRGGRTGEFIIITTKIKN